MFSNSVKLFYFCLTFSLCSFFTMPVMAEYPDLAGYWNFNGNTLDLSGNDSNGTVTGTTTYTNGKVGQAFSFDGNTSINCATNSSLSIADNISIELWFYPEQWVSGFAAHPISKWTSTTDVNYVMYFFGDTSGSNYKKINFLANAGGSWMSVSPSFLIPALNTWYHIVWTYNSTSGGKLYVNGVSQGNPVGSGVLTTNTANLMIGKFTDNLGFNGLIDELKIYNRVLSSSDVAARYQNAFTAGYWNFHGNTLDFSGNDNTGTITGTTTYTSGKVGQAFSFDGNTTIDCATNSSLSIADNISIELWFYPKQWVSGYAAHPINKWTSSTNANYVMYFFGDTGGINYKKIGFLANAGGTWSAVSPYYLIPALNTWYHIVWTYNSMSGGNLYVNGTLYGSSPGYGALATSAANLKIGQFLTNPGFNGLIDEVYIYNRVLSTADVTARYQDSGVSGVMLENDTLKLTVNGTGQITQLLGKSTGQDYKGTGTVAFAKIEKAGVWYSSSSCLQKNGRLLIDFGSANVTAEITTKTMGSYFVFQVYSVYGQTDGLQELQLLNINPPLSKYVNSFSGITGDDNFTLAIRAMNARADVTATVFPGNWYPQYGLALAKFCLLGCPAGSTLPSLQTMIINEGLPSSSKGGPWALNAAGNKDSYIFVYDITANNVSSYITLAQDTKSKIINFYSWWTSRGHYVPKATLYPNGLADMKACVDTIHAAGLKASMHCLVQTIETDDSYVTPVADTRLQKDVPFTLVSINGTTISATSQLLPPTGGLNTTSNTLQIDNELITYASYTVTGSAPPYAYSFTGCNRGAYGTTIQTHATGASGGHLRMAGGCFCPDPDSTLVNEIAVTLANVVNYCGFDMVYLDAVDLAGSSYAATKWGTTIFNRIKSSVRVEAATWDHHFWTFYSNMGAFDYPIFGVKSFVEQHAAIMNYNYKTALLPVQLGWWYILGYDDDYYSQFPDEMELLCTRALGYDAALSYENLFLSSPDNVRQYEYLQMANAYEALRASGSVPDTVKTQLKTLGSEFHLTTGGTIIQRNNVAQKITSLTDGSNSWTVNNTFSPQPAKFRIQALHSDVTTSYASGPNISITEFQNAGDFVLTNALNVTSSLTVNGGICTYTATNNGTTPVGAWTEASKTFSPALNISGGYDTFGVWVTGDGKGEILNFQLYQSTPYPVYDEHYVVVNFTGRRFFELFLRERDADSYYNYSWPYGYIGCYSLHIFPLARNSISNLNIYYNNLPVNQQVSCLIEPVRALLTESISITNPSVNVNGTTITFPVTLQSGQYIEFYSMSDCKRYDTDGTFIANVTPTGTVPTLMPGNNNVTFNGAGIAGYNTRAKVTMFIGGNQIYP